MTLDLTEEEAAVLTRELEIIKNDRYYAQQSQSFFSLFCASI
jgi:hypothetical protein